MGAGASKLPAGHGRGIWKFNRAWEKHQLSKYGLYRDDVLRNHPDVEQAIRMLPPTLQVQRWRRISRAQDLNMKAETLPPHLRPTEDQIYSNYLQPYIKQVQAAKAERAAYNAQ